MDKIKELNELINNAKHLIFFGGAGVSTASGIPDFRSPKGLYRENYKYPPEEILSYSFFIEKTKDFYEFYNEKILIEELLPNIVHKKLAMLEDSGKLKAVITQNIDGLHQKAGSKRVFEIHGSVENNYCMNCLKYFKKKDFDYQENGILYCACNGIIKPDIVLYQESLNEKLIEKVIKELELADTLIVGGTSLTVYPAAGLIDYFNGKLIIINKSLTHYDNRANLLLMEDLSEVFKRIEVR